MTKMTAVPSHNAINGGGKETFTLQQLHFCLHILLPSDVLSKDLCHLVPIDEPKVKSCSFQGLCQNFLYLIYVFQHFITTFYVFLSASSHFVSLPGHSHPMDMPGRGPNDERDSGIARSGTLIRLAHKAWIDPHPGKLSVLWLRFEMCLSFIL